MAVNATRKILIVYTGVAGTEPIEAAAGAGSGPVRVT